MTIQCEDVIGADTLTNDIGTIHTFINGPTDGVIPVTGGVLPTLRGIISSLQQYIMEIAGFQFETLDYPQLRQYRGVLRTLIVYKNGLAGTFVLDSADNITADNGVTVIRDALGRRWKRIFAGSLDPRWAGAVGDGVTLDTVAVQLVLNVAAALKLPVDFQGLNYKLGILTIPTDSVLVGSRAKLDFSSAGAVEALVFGANVKMTGFLEVKGPGNAVFQLGSKGVVCRGTENLGAAPTYIHGPYIRDCIFRGWGAYGVYLEYCEKYDVQYNEFWNIGYGGVGLLSCSGVSDHNLVDDVSPGNGGNAYGIFWSRKESGLSELEQPRSKNGSSCFNTIRNIPLWEGIDTHGGENITIMNNTFENVKTPVALVASSIGATEGLAPRHCKVMNNQITGGGGVAVSLAGAFNGAAVVQYAVGNEISSNSMKGGGIAGNANSGVIRMLGTDGTQIHDNFIDGGGPFGICVLNDNKNFNISGGTIRDASDAVITICGGVAVRANNNQGFIGGLTFVRENVALPNVMEHSILVTVGLTGIDITYSPCQFIGDTTNKLSVVVPAAIPTGKTNNVMQALGNATVTLVNGATSNLFDVVFAKPFVAIPDVMVARTSLPTVGGLMPDIQVTNKTRTGFRVIARPYTTTVATPTAWTAGGAMTFSWAASA